MKKFMKLTAWLMAGMIAFSAGTVSVKAADVPMAAPSVATTIQYVEFGYDPGKIVLPYGAILSKDAAGNWVLAFLDTSFAVLSGKGFVPLANGFTVGLTGEGIVYYKNINGVPIKVTYNLSNCVARVDAGNTIAFYKNGSLLSSKITNYGSAYSVETYNDNGVILRNEVHETGTNRLIALDDYVKTPGMIVRTLYDPFGNIISTLPYYGDTKPAFY
ncbi:MAG: hypothetical protein K6D90_10745 [Lachnospiraceae bacterium]|nr:hypothetical protein [Lachnospiraceae bacterium]